MERQRTRASHGHVLTNVNAWSPDGRWVVYLREEEPLYSPAILMIMRADGTERRRVGSFMAGGSADWSPDGRWLLARTADGLAVVDPLDGRVLPLPFHRESGSAVWRP